MPPTPTKPFGRLRGLPIQLGGVHGFLVLLTFVFIWHFSQRANANTYDSGWLFAASIVITFVGVLCQTQLALALGGSKRWLRITNAFVLVTVTLLLLGYHQKTHVAFDSTVVIDQSDVPLSKEALEIVASSINWSVVYGGLAAYALLFIAELRWKRSFPEQRAPIWKNGLMALGLYAGSLALPLPSYDEPSGLLRSFFRRNGPEGFKIVLGDAQYPLLRTTEESAPLPQGERRRDVFLILVESFNARFAEAKASNGREYTPFLNSLIAQGMYVERFYGNSVQTAKGQFATLCSLIPSMSAKEYVRFFTNDFYCLPKVLEDAGYYNVFFQAYKKLNYDNTRNFLRRNGFERVESVTSHLQGDDPSSIWGWGLQDDVFYRRFFQYFDDELNEASDDSPVFVTLAPISNHMRFNRVPVKKRAIFSNPSRPEEHFANTVNIADQGLKAFFAELKRRKRFDNAIVIVTGDHSFPVGEHGYYHNEANAYDEFFRVPLLIIAPGLVRPERIRDIPFSQLDIAPTVLDLTHSRPKTTHFMGTSLMEQPRVVHPIYLVQPYSGRYLAVVEFPFKYVHHVYSGQSHLYNLATDPKEQQDLVKLPNYRPQQIHLRSLLRNHFLVDEVLERNQVWPAAGVE